MKWRTGFVLIFCFGVLAAKAAAPAGGFNFSVLLDPLHRLGKVSDDVMPQIEWTKERLQAVQQDPEIATLLDQLNVPSNRVNGCQTDHPAFSPGFNAAQWLLFKQKAQVGMNGESISVILGPYYCLVKPEAIHRSNYQKAVAKGSVKVARWLPANTVSQNNVLDVYFQDDKLLTFDLYPLTK